MDFGFPGMKQQLKPHYSFAALSASLGTAFGSTAVLLFMFRSAWFMLLPAIFLPVIVPAAIFFFRSLRQKPRNIPIHVGGTYRWTAGICLIYNAFGSLFFIALGGSSGFLMFLIWLLPFLLGASLLLGTLFTAVGISIFKLNPDGSLAENLATEQ